MGKWAWRALDGGDELWLDIIKGCVGKGEGDERKGFDLIKPNYRIKGWWGEVLKCATDYKGDWFERAVVRNVGNGVSSSFWEDRWVGEVTLREAFPRLFNLCLNKSCSVAAAGEWEGERWIWRVGWRREFREWESELMNNLLELLLCRKVVADVADKWRWKLDKSGIFSVKSSYVELVERKLEIGNAIDKIGRLIWGNLAAKKFQATAWRIIFRKIATRYELRKRGAIQPSIGIKCPLCDDADETIDHLFVECGRAWELWSRCLKWFGMNAAMPNNARDNFLSFYSLAKRKKVRLILASVWVCTVWLIWKQRNEIVFNSGSWKSERMLGEIKSRVWSWIGARTPAVLQLHTFGDWCSNPLICCSSL